MLIVYYCFVFGISLAVIAMTTPSNSAIFLALVFFGIIIGVFLNVLYHIQCSYNANRQWDIEWHKERAKMITHYLLPIVVVAYFPIFILWITTEFGVKACGG